jgi:DNA-binding transcriptional LysR family regulator
MAEAAALGFGVALLPGFMARAEIGRGRLVAAAAPCAVEGQYFCVWPQMAPPSRPLALFLDWLRGGAAA